ncbi:MAG: AAA family ATPase [Acidithiobacillales bacterium]
MRIERVRIAGFGPLSDVDLDWPEGRLLLVLDRNERGKTTLCEAVVTALYGLPRGRGGGRLRELRRPRSGAPLRVGLDLVADGRRWSVDRDLDGGELRIVDRDRGVEATREFLRPGGRDGFGEAVTGGLPEALFRATAYVSQNVLDRDSLDASLTVELARIADSGGGEASVVRALKLLEAARREMPEARTGPTVSIETEIVRLGRKLEELRAERARLAGFRAAAAEASSRLLALTRSRDAARERLSAALLGVVKAERRAVARRLAELTAAGEALAASESEAAGLAGDAAALPPARLAAIDRLRSERGTRPEAHRAAREERAIADAREKELLRQRERRFGPALALSAESRENARRLLEAAASAAVESGEAGRAVDAQWEELQRRGVAEDLRRLDALPPESRSFLEELDEKRTALELEGVRFDRKLADARATLSILRSERHQRLQRARILLIVAAGLVPLAVWMALASLPVAAAAGVGAAALILGIAAAFGWIGGAAHRREEEERVRVEDEADRRSAAEVRRRLSELRRRLESVARAAGFSDGPTLVKAQRRVRVAGEARRQLLDRQAQLQAARARAAQIAADLAPYQEALGLPAGFPDAEAASRGLRLLREVEEAVAEERSLADRAARETERLEREGTELAEIERALREELKGARIPDDVSLPEALGLVEASRRRLFRRTQLLEVEIPARREAADEDERARLVARLSALDAEIADRELAARSGAPPVETVEEPEAARRVAEGARAALEAAEAERLAAERELAVVAREGGERARDVEEALAETASLLDRATLFRDALDLAREALASAAATVYGDFRRGLAEASRAILSSWGVPYEGLEFGDDLSVSAVGRGGRVATKAEIESAFSTGAREQIHLTARLAVLRYLGTGVQGVPLLLDDPLTGTDDDRFLAVMEFLIDHVLGERPVLLLSCHGWRHERLLASLPPGDRGRLAIVSLSSGRPAGPA